MVSQCRSQVHLDRPQYLRSKVPCVFRKLLKYAVLNAGNVSIVMTTAADLLKGMYHIDVHNISIGRYFLAFPQACCLKLYVWMVRTVTFLAKLFSCADSAMVVSCGMVWSVLMPLQFAFLIGLPYSVAECSYLEALLSMSQGHVNPRDYQRVMDGQWQLTQQTYGLYRPSRDGLLYRSSGQLLPILVLVILPSCRYLSLLWTLLISF